MTLVSVCIRTHDRPDDLRRAVSSVLAQSHRDFELIISDDTGGAREVAREFADARVRYLLSPPRASPTASLRTAFSDARGELLALLDDDDRWHEDFLANAVGPFEREPDLGIVFSSYYIVAGTNRFRRKPRIADGRHDQFLAMLLETWPVAPSAAVLRRAVWDDGERELPLRDEALGAGTIWLRAAAAGWPFYYLDQPLMDYGVHSHQVSRSTRAPEREIALLERFAFADRRCERLRRERLARARLRQAGYALRACQFRSAWRTVQAARRELDGTLRATGWGVMPAVRSAVLQRAVDRPALLACLLVARGRLHRHADR